MRGISLWRLRSHHGTLTLVYHTEFKSRALCCLLSMSLLNIRSSTFVALALFPLRFQVRAVSLMDISIIGHAGLNCQNVQGAYVRGLWTLYETAFRVPFKLSCVCTIVVRHTLWHGMKRSLHPVQRFTTGESMTFESRQFFRIKDESSMHLNPPETPPLNRREKDEKKTQATHGVFC